MDAESLVPVQDIAQTQGRSPVPSGVPFIACGQSRRMSLRADPRGSRATTTLKPVPTSAQRTAVRVDHVDGAGHAGIEGVDRAQDLQRLFRAWPAACRPATPHRRRAGPCDRAASRSRSSARPSGSSRSCRPSITIQCPRAPRGASMKPKPSACGRPGGRLPLLAVEGRRVAGLDLGDQVVVVARAADRRRPWFRCARAAVRPSVEKTAETGALSFLSTAFDQFLGLRVPAGIHGQHARQRADFHRRLVPARGLEPGILLIDVRDDHRAASGRCN